MRTWKVGKKELLLKDRKTRRFDCSRSKLKQLYGNKKIQWGQVEWAVVGQGKSPRQIDRNMG